MNTDIDAPPGPVIGAGRPSGEVSDSGLLSRNRAVILGPQCSGKSTIRKYLEGVSSLAFIDSDDMLPGPHGHDCFTNPDCIESILRPELETRLSGLGDAIFLVRHCDPSLIRKLRADGFKIIQLVLGREAFEQRNVTRMAAEAPAAASLWADGILAFHDGLHAEGLVDLRVDATQPVEQIAKEILDFLKGWGGGAK